MKLLNVSQEWLGRQSSPVDWCEENYVVTSYIAEFVNTVSNVLFLTIPPISCRLWASYANHVTKQVYVTLALFFVVGLSSTYFHATLSFLGQILDELSILWILVHCCCYYVPTPYRISFFRKHETLHRCFLISVGLAATLVSFYKPETNQYTLFVLGIPLVQTFSCLIKKKKTTEDKGRFWGSIAVTIFCLAVVSWIFDKMFCDVWKRLHLTVFHGLWHILIFVSTYFMQALACYYYALQDQPHTNPELKFWPMKNFGLPYVFCNPRNKNE